MEFIFFIRKSYAKATLADNGYHLIDCVIENPIFLLVRLHIVRRGEQIMNQYNKNCIALLFLSVAVLIQSSDTPTPESRLVARKQQRDQFALEQSDTFNPLLDSRYNPEDLERNALAFLCDFEPQLQEALNAQKGERDGISSLSKFLGQYQYNSDKYESYSLYVVVWMKLKPALWEQLEKRQHELGISDFIAGKMQHPTLRLMRKKKKNIQ